MKFRNLAALALLLTACGGTVEDTNPETDTVDLADAPADSLAQLRVRADGMTVWAEPVISPSSDWLFEGRVSHSISEISATVNGRKANAKAVSARKFEIKMDTKAFEDNLGEYPLLIDITTTTGKNFTVMMVARARFENTTGSSKVYPWKNIEPVMVGRDRFFRGRVTAPADAEWVQGWNDDDSEPIAYQVSETHWNFDWYAGALAWAAHPTEDALDIVAETKDGTRYRRWSPIVMSVTKLGVTNEDPSEVWPVPACTSKVRECLGKFDVENDDLASCGSAIEVSPCLAEIPEDNTADWIQRYASDLRSAIIAHYRVHEADIVGSGGNTRPQALVSVDSADIEEVKDEDDNPTGFDLDDHRIFTHPDVTFPGSDMVWFGVYRLDGSLVDVGSFN